MRKIMTLAAGALIAGCTPGGSQSNVEQNVTVVETNVVAPAPVPENAVAPVANAVEAPANTSTSTSTAAALPDDIAEGSDTRTVGCQAYLAHYLDQATTTEEPRVRAAMVAWRVKLEHEMTKDEAAQFFASTYAVDRDVPAATVKSAADYCLKNAPKAS